MTNRDSRGDSPNGENAIQKIGWFGVCYWAAASVQVVGSFGVFGTVGGSPLHAIAGALCLELMILALNAYGVKQSGKWMACICAVSLFLVSASAMFQVAELLSHPADAELAQRLGAGYYGVLRTTVPVVPSVAMALVTLIKFVTAKRERIPSGDIPEKSLDGLLRGIAGQTADGVVVGIVETLERFKESQAELHESNAKVVSSFQSLVGTLQGRLELANERIAQYELANRQMYERQMARRADPKGFVYLIEGTDGAFKIGKATNVSKRFSSLQTSSAAKLTLIHFFESPNALQAESNVHEYFAEKRLVGEWFRLTRLDIATFKAFQDNGTLPEGITQTSLSPLPSDESEATKVAQPAVSRHGNKIDPAQLAAGLAQGKSAAELAQLFGVTEAGIRKTAEWRARPKTVKAVQS